MAAFSLTASSIKLASGASIFVVDAGEAISAGQAVTQEGEVVDPTNSNKYAIAGLAIQNADSGGRVVVAGPGCRVVFSDTVTQGQPVYADASGQLQYATDLTAGDRVIEVGVTDTANSIVVTAQDKQASKV